MSKRSVTYENIAKSYDRLAERYDSRWKYFHAAAHDWIVKRINDAPQNVLELGCGTGLLLKHIHDKYPAAQLSGIDASANMLRLAQNRLPDATFTQADITAEIEGQFDIVLSVNVLHHTKDPQAHIGSLHRLCAANGTAFLCDFAINTLSLQLAEQYWRQFHPAHQQAFSKEELKEMLYGHFTIKDEAVLKPDWFWRLQIYKLHKA